MAARGPLLRRTFFAPSLVSCLRYRLFLLWKTPNLQAISEEKNTFKPLCWNVNENQYEVDVAIDRAGYHYNEATAKQLLFRFFRSFYLASVSI